MACMDLTAPENGAVSPMSGFEGDIATYSCESGFTPLGDTMRTCEVDGWTGAAPVCEEIEGAINAYVYNCVCSRNS